MNPDGYAQAIGIGTGGFGQLSQPPPPPRETLRSKLAETQERLALCENMTAAIYEKLNGPVPLSVERERQAKQPEPPSVSALAMDNFSRATRLRDALEGIANQLA